MEARSPSTRPSARRTGPVDCPPRCPVPGSMRLKADALRAPCTFSQTTSLGRRAVIAWNIDFHSPERVSLDMPARAPASERSVQGEPPQITSTGSTWLQSMRVMSPRLGTSGWWWARMAWGPGSMSLTQARRAGPRASCTPSSRPPLIAREQATDRVVPRQMHHLRERIGEGGGLVLHGRG